MSEPGTDLEVIEDADYAPVQAGTLFGTDDPAAVIERAASVAGSLADVVRKQGLVSMIQGKEYPRVEAWTLLGSMLGVFPVVVWSREVGDGLGWEARVEVRTRDGAVVGAAEAECLRSERTWAKRDSYALRSMCQTRATSKALRGPLGFVMSLAGFEATPESEMPGEPAPATGGGAAQEVRTDGQEPATSARSYAEWVKRMLALEVPRPQDWGKAAAEAAGVKADLQRLNRVLLWFSDNEPASSLGFWSTEEVQAGFAVGFEGALAELPAPDPEHGPEPDPPQTASRGFEAGQYPEDPSVEFAPELPLVEP